MSATWHGPHHRIFRVREIYRSEIQGLGLKVWYLGFRVYVSGSESGSYLRLIDFC